MGRPPALAYHLLPVNLHFPLKLSFLHFIYLFKENNILSSVVSKGELILEQPERSDIK